MSRKNIEAMLPGIPDLECSGVYALVDDIGNMYISLTKNLKKRLRSHNRGLCVAARGEHDAFESIALQDAISSGRRFHIILLATFPSGISDCLLRQFEREFIAEYSKTVHLYNDKVHGKYPDSFLRSYLARKAKNERRLLSRAKNDISG